MYALYCVQTSPLRPLSTYHRFSFTLAANPICLCRENAIAIESEAKDPFGGNAYYVTMHITLPIPEYTFAQFAIYGNANDVLTST